MPRLRSRRQFAEEEIVLPAGPFEGQRFSCDRQPHTALWFEAVDSGRYREIVTTGPSQSGKSLLGFVLPICYHLFEVRETVICGVPRMDLADEKWQVDILPVIARSRFARFLPRNGPGSRGGSVAGGRPVTFGNGTHLLFKSGGGDDKARASSTARVLVITETDGFDEVGSTSREADKIAQLEARTRAYGDRALVYKECTVSLETGHTWVRYQAGTRSRIVLPCPHCEAWVSPEREHLVGWQDAADELAAEAAAAFCCPACGQRWSDQERVAANLRGRLLHRGQSIDAAGTVHGEHPPTRTLGYRWSAVNNLLMPGRFLAAKEWQAARAVDEVNAEKELRQFFWALPHEPARLDLAALDFHAVRRRFLVEHPKGIVPAATKWLTCGVDLGKRLGWWILVGWFESGSGHICDYGSLEVPSDDLGVERALTSALREFRERVNTGWAVAGSSELRLPNSVWIDTGWESNVVYAFLCDPDTGRRFRGAKGQGASQQDRSVYHRPKKTGGQVRHVGLEYHVVYLPSPGVFLIEVNADYWKTWSQQRLATPLDQPGALSVYHAPPNEHTTLAKHLTAERQIEEFVPGRGPVTRWLKERAANHYADALYNACAAAHLCGLRLFDERRAGGSASAAAPPAGQRLELGRAWLSDDGRPYLVTERAG